MAGSILSYLRPLGVLLSLSSSLSVALGQQNLVADLRNSEIATGIRSSMVSEPAALPGSPANILARFIAVENDVREALNQHTFRRDVVLQTIGPNGEVTGEYVRNSEFVFDDRGNRIERVLYHPRSTIREMRITKEDIQDLAGAQLLGIDITESANYQLGYLGREVLGSTEALVIDVSPRQKPDPHHMSKRFFVGTVWIDPASFQILKVKGIVEPHGKQRFPKFETWRESIDPSLVNSSLFFPSRTKADDILQFAKQSVHYRIKIRYYDYRRFGSRLTISEVEPPSSN
jgi:hypothetical protein